MDVVAVQVQDLPFYVIYLIKIFCFYIFSHGLRHSANNEILSEVIHSHTVHGLSHLTLFLKVTPDEWHQSLVAHSPQKLFEVHRVDLVVFFISNTIGLNLFVIDSHK